MYNVQCTVEQSETDQLLRHYVVVYNNLRFIYTFINILIDLYL